MEMGLQLGQETRNTLKAKLDGGMKFFIYEYTRQLDKDRCNQCKLLPDRQ